MFCHQCGHRNPQGANFCSSCGAALSPHGDETTITFMPVEAAGEAEDELTVTLDELAESIGMLVVKRGPNAGSKFALDKAITKAGRHPESDIFLDDITVSRRHAEIAQKGQGYVVRDVGSLNGTYVDHKRVDTAPLHHLADLQIGRFVLVFLVGSGST